ncbi:DegV family protein [uncultured Dysosmobacter sp.]|uniref:DegV family protein n=1 Tax=uncultured Dysosmobacter sp. TaxID=2591384 RepID=UPI0026355F4A|nr:DegV family protein [uncultured Dysosmobacter sp.]
MIKITTDSTCDLPAWLLEQHNITVIPLGIVKGDRLYQDGVNIRPADIAAYVDAGGDITTTNAVNIADYETLFRAESRKYDAVIHLNIGPGFSSCHQNARLAAEEVPGVYVADSANLSVGHGLLVLAAAEAAEAGKSVPEILAMLEDMAPRVEMSFVLDRLDYMKKGGRCSAVTALGANLLKLHPCIEVIDGKMSVTKKYRGSIEKVVADYIRERLADRTDIDSRRAILVDTCPDDALAGIVRDAVRARFDEVIEAKAGCTIFSHSGNNTLGVVFLRK